MNLKIVCAWCQREVGSKECDDPDIGEGRITHTICEECKQTVMAEIQNYQTQTNERKKQ